MVSPRESSFRYKNIYITLCSSLTLYPSDLQKDVMSQKVSISFMEDHELSNEGDGPPAHFCPWNWTICLVSPHIQAESSGLEYLFTSSGVTKWQWYSQTCGAPCAEKTDLLHIGTFRSIFIYISVLIFSLFSYSGLCCLPELLLACGEMFGILYTNVMDKESTLSSSEENHYINLINLKYPLIQKPNTDHLWDTYIWFTSMPYKWNVGILEKLKQKSTDFFFCFTLLCLKRLCNPNKLFHFILHRALILNDILYFFFLKFFFILLCVWCIIWWR